LWSADSLALVISARTSNDQDDAQPEPGARSTSDATSGHQACSVPQALAAGELRLVDVLQRAALDRAAATRDRIAAAEDRAQAVTARARAKDDRLKQQ
jgi:hypothetical protein